MKILEEKNMDSSSILQSNMTQVSFLYSKLIVYTLFALIFLIILVVLVFTCFIIITLNVFFTTPQIQDSARYVLFVYMLMNDTFFLLLGFYFFLTVVYKLYIPVPLCYILYILSSITFRITPYNLAAMALEQYVAICHPLQHVELCTAYRAHMVFIFICSLLTIPYAVELFVMLSSMTNIFHLYIICKQELLIVNPIQNVLRSIDLILSFTLVGTVILVTYFKIMLVARRLSSRPSPASKAGKTVMLHAFQLLLCMVSLLSQLTEYLPIKQAGIMPFINFLAFTCISRLLSPLIYGFRDETLREHMKRSLQHFSRGFFF
ncbi:odorant receptor 131-2-like [Bufo bufo]|uniref:odorant receptor 131-2-like n=1 Tax=Bufo bufo TaxID=8384 RepID=UPI001ABEB2E4|nr:odorant receptor 131-2-like [Bufo bufo]